MPELKISIFNEMPELWKMGKWMPLTITCYMYISFINTCTTYIILNMLKLQLIYQKSVPLPALVNINATQ